MLFVAISIFVVHVTSGEQITYLYQKNLPSKDKFLVNYAILWSDAPFATKKAFNKGHCGMLCMSSFNPSCLGFKFEGRTKMCTLLFSSFDSQNGVMIGDLDSFYGRRPGTNVLFFKNVIY